MKNLLVYYVCFISPLFLLMAFWNHLEPIVTLLLLCSYVLVYRTWPDGIRLYKKGLISKKDIWKMIYNGTRMDHFKALYLEK